MTSSGERVVITAAFYQFSPAFGRREDNIDRVAAALHEMKLDLLVLPEFFATGYQFLSTAEVEALADEIPAGYTTQRLVRMARERGMHIVAGLPEREGDRFFNSAIIVGPDGFIGSYRKTHLFFEEKLFFASGDSGFRVWDTKIGRIGIMICFDWFFPESMRILALKGADIVAHPANLVLPYCPESMPVRCRENRVYAITANRTGVEERRDGYPLRFIGQSRIVTPEGEVVIATAPDEEVLRVAEIEPETARNKRLNPFNDLFADRRPEFYHGLIEPLL